MTDRAQQLQAVDVRKPQIKDHQVWLLVEQLQRSLAIGCVDNLIAMRGQSHPQQLSDWRLVVDDEDSDGRRGHSAAPSCWAVSDTGREIVKMAPLRSERFAATIVPCRASTNPREIAKPSPVPALT